MNMLAIAAALSLTGTWELVRVDNVLSGGARVELYGPAPQGLLVFDGHGRYSLQIFRAARPRFASNDKSSGTPEEYRAAVTGTNAHVGRYRVEGGFVDFVIEHASFPNWEGTTQRRSFQLEGDRLVYRVPVPTSGPKGAVGEVEWRRVR